MSQFLEEMPVGFEMQQMQPWNRFATIS